MISAITATKYVRRPAPRWVEGEGRPDRCGQERYVIWVAVGEGGWAERVRLGREGKKEGPCGQERDGIWVSWVKEVRTNPHGDRPPAGGRGRGKTQHVRERKPWHLGRSTWCDAIDDGDPRFGVSVNPSRRGRVAAAMDGRLVGWVLSRLSCEPPREIPPVPKSYPFPLPTNIPSPPGG